MKRRKFINRVGWLSMFALAPYKALAFKDESRLGLDALIVDAGNAENERDRFEIIQLIADELDYSYSANILLDIADKWANGLANYWTPEDDVSTPIEESKGYLGGFFGVSSFPNILFELIQTLDIDISDLLPEGFELPETNYPNEIPLNSRLYPLWALYKGRMLVWAGLEFNLGEFYFPEARILLGIAGLKFPQNNILKIYNNQPQPWAIELSEDSNAPSWANDMREALNKGMDIIEFWIRERQAPDGQFGGGWGDDVEIWRDWIPFLVGFNIEELNTAMTKLADGLWNLDRMNGGYTSIMSDVEHAAEDSADTLTMMQLISDDEIWKTRAKQLINLFENTWTGINDKGKRQFISTYFNSEENLDNPDTFYQVSLHFRALQPVFLAWLKDEEDESYQIIIDWLIDLAELSIETNGSKPSGVIPAAINWPSGDTGVDFDWWDPGGLNGFYKKTFKYPSFLSPVITTFAQAYYLTRDQRFLTVLQNQVEMRKSYINDEFSDTQTEGTIGWAADELGSRLIDAYDKLKVLEIDLDESFPQVQSSPYHQWAYNDDFSKIEEALTSLKQDLGYNKAMFTSEVRFTDRIDAFNKEYTSQFTSLDLSKPDGGILYNLITGDPRDPFYFPLNQIRWTADPRNTAIRVKTLPDRLIVDIHNFLENVQIVEMELKQAEGGWIDWGNGEFLQIGKKTTLELNQNMTTKFTVLFEMPVNTVDQLEMRAKIYPNPFIDEITVDLNWNSNIKAKGELRVVGTDGAFYSLEEFKISTGPNVLFKKVRRSSDLFSDAGVYFIQLLSNEKIIFSKTVVRIIN